MYSKDPSNPLTVSKNVFAPKATSELWEVDLGILMKQLEEVRPALVSSYEVLSRHCYLFLIVHPSPDLHSAIDDDIDAGHVGALV